MTGGDAVELFAARATVPTYSLVRGDLLAALLPYALLLLAVCGTTLATGLWMERRRPRLQRLLSGEAGTSEIEFVVAFPVFLMQVTVIVQMILMVNALLIVDYAAYCAARSASVWIGHPAPGEEQNTIGGTDTREDSPKWQRIDQAARIAVVPISPRPWSVDFAFPWLGSHSLPNLLAMINGSEVKLEQYMSSAGVPQVSELATLPKLAGDFVSKFFYAYFMTEVRLLDASGQAVPANMSKTFGAEDSITAEVTHNFQMAVPFGGAALSRLLGGALYMEHVLGVRLPRLLTTEINEGWFLPITTRYTMASWGRKECPCK